MDYSSSYYLASYVHFVLDFLQKRIGKGKSEQLDIKKSLHTLDDHDLDVEDSPENMDEWLSSDEEVFLLAHSI